MVEFCCSCGGSLPKGDLTFKEGKGFTSHDYICPACNNFANPAEMPGLADAEAGEDKDLVIRNGEVSNG